MLDSVSPSARCKTYCRRSKLNCPNLAVNNSSVYHSIGVIRAQLVLYPISRCRWSVLIYLYMHSVLFLLVDKWRVRWRQLCVPGITRKMSALPELVILLVTLPFLVFGNTCPELTGCTCLPPGRADVRCNNADRFPALGTDSVKLDMSNSRLASPVLQKRNFTGLQHLEQLSLSGCGITIIEYNTFSGEFP